MSAEALVEVAGLTRYFDVSKPFFDRLLAGLHGGMGRQRVRAAHDVTFSIKAGDTFALVGESGCGKSTVARMIAGLIRPSAGSITIDGAAMTGPGARTAAGRLQMIFQDPYASLNPRWTVGRIIAEPIQAYGLARGRSEVRRRVGELLKLVQLDPADMSKYPHEFSGGQRQRIAIARALSSRPDFIICDEPTSALDVSVQAQILNLMCDLQDELGLTYLFISHNLAVVRHMAHRIGVMYLGELVEIADGPGIFDNPKHPYTRMLLDAVPDPDTTGEREMLAVGEVPDPIDPPPGCVFHPRCPLVFARCRSEAPRLAMAEGRLVACHAVSDGQA
jgi:peptide/nickel transport system ATP-binding protein